MAENKTQKAGSVKHDRQERLAAALRENLKKRKAQAQEKTDRAKKAISSE